MSRTTLRDLLMLMLLGFVFMVAIMWQWINPEAVEDSAVPPGNVVVHAIWPEGDQDVDLWVMGPGELVPVGYSNKGGIIWNLLRDDLGNTADHTKLNFENSYSRGVAPGEYIVNVHCFRCAVFPIPVEIEVRLKKDHGASLKTLVSTEVLLHRNKEEKTAIRFKLDRNGDLVPDSVNRVFKPLRAMQRSLDGR